MLERLGQEVSSTRAAIQGFGNVGGLIAKEMCDRGATVVALCDITGEIVNADGIEVAESLAGVAESRFCADFPAAEREPEG